MHPVLLTLVALGINSGDPVQAPKAPTPHKHELGCADCGPGAHGLAAHREIKKALHAQHQMMPQTCYDPSFGCYTGSRFMNRYPAFHGSYYRRPYNYRNVFDYPWHADLHEPTSLFSYNVVAPSAAPATGDTPESIPVRPIEPTTSRDVRGEQVQPIGTGVRTNNPFRSASSTTTTETSQRSATSSSSRRRTQRRGAVTKPHFRR